MSIVRKRALIYFLLLFQITFTEFRTDELFFVEVYEDIYTFQVPMINTTKFTFGNNFKKPLPYTFRVSSNNVSIVYFSNNPKKSKWALEWTACNQGIIHIQNPF